MSDTSTKTITGVFETRELADRAVERLVQEHGLKRADIFVSSAEASNSAGNSVSGGDAARNEPEFEPPLRGQISVSVDLTAEQAEAAAKTFRELGGKRLRQE